MKTEDDPHDLIRMVRKIDDQTRREALSMLHLCEDRRQAIEAYVEEIKRHDA